MLSQQFIVFKKNLTVSFRNKDLLIDALIPMIVGLMFALRTQLSSLSQIMPILYALAIYSTSRSIMIRIVQEKTSRYKETRYIMGLQRYSYNFGWLMSAYIRMLMAITVFQLSYYLFSLAVSLDWSFYYIIDFTQQMWPYYIYGIAAINQSMFYATLFDEQRIAGEVNTFFCIAMVFLVYFTFMESATTSLAFYVISGLLSPQANIGFAYISSLQVGYNRLGCQIPFVIPDQQVPENIFPVALIRQYYTVEDATYQLIGNSFLYFFLFLICDQFVPSQHGIQKSPIKIIKNLFEVNPFKSESLLSESSSQSGSSAIYEEEFKINDKPTITIDNLSKNYGSMNAVDNITFQLYESQIFCLLGHNGAGKTTTISMLTGMIEKTCGKVVMYNKDLDTHLSQIRLNLGLCTQQDILEDELTVQEHLQFVCDLKSKKLDDDELRNILQLTDLDKECHVQAKVLSGGSKRKLSLAMALVGNSQIIFLDEPTSGMDAYSRRAIWDILKKIKQQNRTIILTTHHLDEADLLADRIGIMSKGLLLAVGTPEYIKRQFGEGYKLQLSGENIDQTIVTRHIPDAQMIPEESSDNIITYQIVFKDQDKLDDLFKELQLHDYKIGLKLNTLEDAFIKIGEEEDKYFQASSSTSLNMEQSMITIQSDDSQSFHIPDCLTTPPTYSFKLQLESMALRKYYITIRTSTNIIAIILPVIAFIFGLVVTKYMTFSGMMAQNIEQQDFLKLQILGGMAVLCFSFNSILYVTLPVFEKETQLKKVLTGMGLRIKAYWFGTFLLDFTIYMILVAIYFVICGILRLELILQYSGAMLWTLITFGFSYLPFSYTFSFMFQTSEKAMKVFTIFTFFCGFCGPLIILGVITYIDQVTAITSFSYLIYTFEIIFMLTSPFYNIFFCYAALQNNPTILESAYAGMPLISTNLYIYSSAMLLQALIFTTIILVLELNKSNLRKINIIKLFKDQSTFYQQKKEITALEALDLNKKYEEEGPNVLDGISFDLLKGQTFSIIGPNKAGKSTLINILTGIIQQSSGNVRIMNQDLQDLVTEAIIHVGICPQFDSLWESLTTEEHLYLYGRIKGLKGNDLKESVDYFIHSMELTRYRKTRAGALSGGNKRKLCVSNALIGGSDITFFDEPSTGVDPISRKALFRTLKRNVQYRKCTAILVTHTIDEAESLGDQIGILVKGKFACIDTPDQLKNKYAKIYQIQLMLNDYNQEQEIIDLIEKKLPKLKFAFGDQKRKTLTFSIEIDKLEFYKTYQYLNLLKVYQKINQFTISQGTLENIFLEFSSQQPDEYVD